MGRMLYKCFAPQLIWIRKRLSPKSFFGLELSIGILLLIGAAWLFGGIAEDVVDGDPLTVWDDRIALWFHTHQNAYVTSFMLRLSAAHDWATLAIPVTLLLGYLLWRKAGAWVITVACAVPGGMLLNTLLKLVFHRDRPTYSGLAEALRSYSFPSGHVMAATVFWGTLALYLASLTPHWRWRALLMVGAATMVALVALSRLYLGVHYFSDVCAAAAEGVAWLTLCRISVNTYLHNQSRTEG